MIDYHHRLTLNTLLWLERQLPYTNLFHYTRSDTAISILNSKTLRSYDIWKMDDDKEFHHGIDLFTSLYRKRNLEPHLGSVEVFIKQQIRYPTLRYFVSSFTTSHRKQKHWDTFSDKNTGVCFKFNNNELQLSGKGKLDIFMGSNVQYSSSFQIKIMNRLLDHYEANLKRILKGFLKGQQGDIVSRLNLGIFQAIITYALIFKTSKYRWEDEYRLISFVHNSSLIKRDLQREKEYVELIVPESSSYHTGKKCSTSFPDSPFFQLK